MVDAWLCAAGVGQPVLGGIVVVGFTDAGVCAAGVGLGVVAAGLGGAG